MSVLLAQRLWVCGDNNDADKDMKMDGVAVLTVINRQQQLRAAYDNDRQSNGYDSCVLVAAQCSHVQ